MATWKAIRSSSQDRSQDKQLDIEQAFKVEWLHGRICGEGEAAIWWRLLPPPYTFLISLMIEGAVACCLPPRKGFTLRRPAETTSKWFFFPGLPSWSPEIVPKLSPVESRDFGSS